MARGKYGRTPFNPERPHLVLEKYLHPRTPLSRASLPPVTLLADVDRASAVPSWPMYMNDQLGCCVPAGKGHMFGAMSWYGSGVEALFADSEIVATYSRDGGYVAGEASTDQGCDMQTALANAVTYGMTDTTGKVHKALGYARFGNPADEVLLGQVLDVFGSVYVGINVQQVIETEFDAGQPWTYVPGQPWAGGHCVVLQRRYPSTSAPVLEYVTWGALQRAYSTFQAHAAEEAWAVVTQDWVRANGTSVEGMNVAQLLADMADVA